MAKVYVNRTIQMGGKIHLPGAVLDLSDKEVKELVAAELVVPFPSEPSSDQLLAAAEAKAKQEATDRALREKEAAEKAKAEEEAKASEAAKAKAAK